MNTPLIFLAFANDPDAHLALLKEESRQIYAALAELDRKEYIKIHREESAQTSDIFAGFTQYKDRVAIFHYGGHANGAHLKLEAGKGDAKGLATLMGEQTNLKLVFLNGCSSKGQVQALFEAGVKAVIATSVPIEDRKAVEFARQFYEALAHRRTIGQAYSLAEAYIKTHYGEGGKVQFRDAMFDNLEALLAGEKVEEELPWGLYVKEEHKDEILNWKLPYFRPISLPDSIMDGIKRDFTANRYLIHLLDEMGKFNPDIYHKMVEQKGDQTEKVDSSTYPQLLISSFPWPIGGQIRILFVKEWREFGHQRLRQLMSTYIITSQVLYFILLSDFWEQVRQQKIPVPEDLDLHFPNSKENYAQTDWLARIAVVYERMEAHQVSPFAPEYELLVEVWQDEESSFRKAHNLLEKLRSRGDDLPKADLDKVCLRIEQALALVLKQAAFLCRYRMLTIRNILIDAPRTEPLVYELDMGHLSNSDGNFLHLYQDAEKRRKQTYTNSRSIILVSNEDIIHEFLDLSPFIMDRNTFVNTLQGGTSKDDNALIFLMGWEEAGKLYFISVDQSIHITLSDPLHQVHSDMTQEDFDEGKIAAAEDFSVELMISSMPTLGMNLARIACPPPTTKTNRKYLNYSKDNTTPSKLILVYL
ncbi:MAG: CHAT domain-containing protein [Bacteroidia bacterium]